MKKLWMCLLAVSLLAMSACGTEEDSGGTNNGAANNSAANNSAANNDAANNSAANNDAANNDAANNTNNVGVNNDVNNDSVNNDAADMGLDAASPDAGNNDGAPDMDPVDGGAPDMDPVDGGAPDMDPVDGGAPDMDPVDAGTGSDMAQGGVCPPLGPYGTGLGDTIPSITLKDCSGQDRDVHELCEYDVGWMFEFAAWCPPCRAFASGLNDLYNTFDQGRVGMFFIISQDNNFSAPDAAFCRQIEAQYGLDDVTVLFDPSGAFQQQLGVPSNEVNVLTRAGGEIFFKQQYSNSQVEGSINAELSP